MRSVDTIWDEFGSLFARFSRLFERLSRSGAYREIRVHVTIHGHHTVIIKGHREAVEYIIQRIGAKKVS